MAYSRKNLTVGIIGAGQVVQTNHLPVLHAMGITPTWFIDPDPDTITKVASDFGGTAAVSPDKLKSLAEPDVILIGCPYGARGQYYEQLKEVFLGSAIMIEKPIALTVWEHDQIAGLRPDYLMGGGFNRRALGMLRVIKSLIDERVFGQLQICRFEFGGIGVKTGGKYISDLGLAGGGPLFEVAIHYVDAINYLLAASSVDVLDVRIIFDEGIDIHTEAKYLIQSDYGCIPCSITVSFLRNSNNCIEFVFQHASLRFSLFSPSIVIVSADGASEYKLALSPQQMLPDQPHGAMYAMWSDFLAGVKCRSVNYSHLITSRITTETIERIYRKAGRSLP